MRLKELSPLTLTLKTPPKVSNVKTLPEVSESSFLLSKELHAKAISRFPMRSVYSTHVNEIWTADTCFPIGDKPEFLKENSYYDRILVVLDVYSRYAWCEPMKNGSSLSTSIALQDIHAFSKVYPSFLWTDNGSEFLGDTLKLCNENSIKQYHTYSVHKASIAERFIRTLKRKLEIYLYAYDTHNWMLLLDKVVKEYNNAVGSRSRVKPVDVYNGLVVPRTNNDSIPSMPKFNVGDRVRISLVRGRFEKSHNVSWSPEIFVIAEVLHTVPPTYKIRDLKNEIIEGSFYNEELQHTEF